jgi:hypothetical protein
MDVFVLSSCVLLLAQDPPPVPSTHARAPELPLLAAPLRVEAEGAPITAVTGHAAPFVVDYDGDGVRDLVVGMFGSDESVKGGTGRFYKNVGSNAAPRFGAFVTLQADGRPAVMESS